MEPINLIKGRGRKRNEVTHKCSGHWFVDSKGVGVCTKYNKETLICLDSGQRCPYDGVKDFRALERKIKGIPDWMKDKGISRRRRSH